MIYRMDFMKKVTVHISTKINKTNNHYSPNELLNTKRPGHVKLKIQVMSLERHTSVAGLNLLTGSKTSPMVIHIHCINKRSLLVMNINFIIEVDQ